MITILDFRRISQLLFNSSLSGKIPALEKKLNSSRIIPPESAPGDLVTMNSEVVMEDLTTDEEYGLRLVYHFSPEYKNQVSILAPLGTALLGMKLDEIATYRLRDGSFRKIQIKNIIFQPEANNNYEL